MSGIYIHIPFCKQACSYCNFYFLTSLRQKSALLDALKKELIIRANYLQTPIKTIYFGGGTPSLLQVNELSEILNTVHSNYNTLEVKEVTIEVNPNDLNAKILEQYLNIGINRLSIGVQSFSDKDLIFLNRSHDAMEAKNCIKTARIVGFQNFSIDLIYGIPNKTEENWRKNVQEAMELEIPHISCYCLTIEEKTILKHMINKGKIPNISEEKGAQEFDLLMEFAKKYNYSHYEISNFCKEPFFSQHNRSYWQAIHYLGIGPSAHSFNGKSRQWNIANNKKYIGAINNQKIPAEIEFLSEEQKISEYLLTSLRTMWGCDLNRLENKHGYKVKNAILKKAEKYIEEKMIIQKDNALILTDCGKMLADYIILNLT